MEQYPFISCLMPTKNRKRFVAESIRRFMAQDYPGGAELIVLEDGDEDCSDLATAGMLGPHHANREGATVRHVLSRGTIGAKLNHGARLAAGEILANWDDDEWYAPNRLTEQWRHMQATGRALVGLSSALFWTEGDPVAYEYHGGFCMWDGVPSPYALGSSHFYRRDFALAHPHADLSLGEDSAFSTFAHEAGELSTISGLDILVVRNHSANTSPRSRPTEEVFEIGGLRITGSDNWREAPLEQVTAIIGR